MTSLPPHRQRTSCRGLPAVAGQFSKCGSCRTADHQLHVMKGPAWTAVVQEDASRVVSGVFARIPSTLRKIQHANESESIIDDDRLLMMGRTEWMRGILVEMQATVCRELRRQPPFPLFPIDH